MTTNLMAGATPSSALPFGGAACPVADNPTHAHTSMEGGRAVFENDSYRITAGDDNTVTITNKHTGEVYSVAGDPHVSVDGQHAFDFWGTTTFKLDDGTKVTIQTTPWSANPNATLSSKVTITNGDYGVQVTGVDTNTQGDLQIHEAAGWGKALDWAVDDGNVLHENPSGPGFIAVDRQGNLHAVDQAWIDQTDRVKNPGAGPGDGAGKWLAHAYKDAFRLLAGLVSIAFSGGWRSRDEGGHRPGHGRGIAFQPWLGGQVALHADTAHPTNLALTLTRHPG
jgi:hypothetical protein